MLGTEVLGTSPDSGHLGIPLGLVMLLTMMKSNDPISCALPWAEMQPCAHPLPGIASPVRIQGQISVRAGIRGLQHVMSGPQTSQACPIPWLAARDPGEDTAGATG